MIGKIVKGRSFKGAVSYIMDQEKGKLLDSEGVQNTSKEAIINSFYIQSLMNPKLSRCVGHIPLSFSPDDRERLSDHLIIRLAKEYLTEMKIENTQYIIVRHDNTDHPHCHIIFNRVDNDGKTISEKNDHYRNEKACKKLKDKYNLTYGKGKEQVNIQKLKGAEKTKYEIYHAVKSALLTTKDWEQFEHVLNLQGVSIQYKMKGKTDEVQGISFKKGNYSFKASEVDRKFSYSKLNQQLRQNMPTHNKTMDNPRTKESNSVAESIVENVGGIIDLEQHGTDYQEEAFADRMKYEEKERQKKAKRKSGLKF